MEAPSRFTLALSCSSCFSMRDNFAAGRPRNNNSNNSSGEGLDIEHGMAGLLSPSCLHASPKVSGQSWHLLGIIMSGSSIKALSGLGMAGQDRNQQGQRRRGVEGTTVREAPRSPVNPNSSETHKATPSPAPSTDAQHNTTPSPAPPEARQELHPHASDVGSSG